MKFHFEPDLDYQRTAIESVCDLFRGQEICRTEFTVTRDATAPSKRSLLPRATLASALDVDELNRWYVAKQVVAKSALFSPSDIGFLPDNKPHRISFRPGDNLGWFLSEDRKSVV